jgi:hypothetical protein
MKYNYIIVSLRVSDNNLGEEEFLVTAGLATPVSVGVAPIGRLAAT